MMEYNQITAVNTKDSGCKANRWVSFWSCTWCKSQASKVPNFSCFFSWIHQIFRWWTISCNRHLLNASYVVNGNKKRESLQVVRLLEALFRSLHTSDGGGGLVLSWSHISAVLKKGSVSKSTNKNVKIENFIDKLLFVFYLKVLTNYIFCKFICTLYSLYRNKSYKSSIILFSVI